MISVKKQQFQEKKGNKQLLQLNQKLSLKNRIEQTLQIPTKKDFEMQFFPPTNFHQAGKSSNDIDSYGHLYEHNRKR